MVDKLAITRAELKDEDRNIVQGRKGKMLLKNASTQMQVAGGA